ncbi:hypothetical protein RHGRI_013928 [Rhododendron griersonianum]|uniref:KIB1-4 beta-propeller domain-containing protein n=1 Tax=Rhododendron griersonianum TaxID=479676 RepID=A0AAV6K7T1_9ERIC|nr:hypothetical protein RHGRI_013928 [Rhododendron griersonianum]
MNHPAFALYRLGGGEYVWIKQDCTLVDPHSTTNQLIQFTHTIGFNGKSYALSLQGTLAVIEETDYRLRIIGLSKSRAVPSVPSMRFKEYLVESNGEILLVFLIVSRKSIRSVDNVEVYRLRFDILSWVKMEGIGDRTLFVGTNFSQTQTPNCANCHFCSKKMGQKSKKGKQSPLSKKPIIPRAWPDLPPKLLNIVAKNSTLRENISYGGNVTKSYRVPPKQCNPIGKSPFLQLIASGTDQCYADTFNIPFHPGFYIWHGRRGFGSGSLEHIVGYSHGLVFGKDRGRGYVPPSQLDLWGSSGWGGGWNLPRWDTSVPFEHGAISSSPIHGKTPTVMVLTGMNHPAFVFYRLKGGEYVWIKQDCTLVDPHSTNNQLIQFTHAVGFNGKFYALSLQGTLAVIEETDFLITGLSKSRAVPSVPSMRFKEYLVESNGEILLVFLIVSRKSIRSVDNVEVYRLRFDTLSWVKMERIGDRTLFMGTNCCLSVNASEVGCMRNCIYFSYQTGEGWWVYDMERGSISPSWDSTDSSTKSPVWDEPEPEEEEQLVCKKR